ncbi:MAG: Rid family hydrolase [Nitrososphaeraceae archaeon]
MDEIKTISTSSPWESIVGYSRAVRIGNYISVSGTTSIDRRTGKIVGEGDAYMQTVKIIENIEYATKSAGNSK